jgi:hypothetical protein
MEKHNDHQNRGYLAIFEPGTAKIKLGSGNHLIVYQNYSATTDLCHYP